MAHLRLVRARFRVVYTPHNEWERPAVVGSIQELGHWKIDCNLSQASRCLPLLSRSVENLPTDAKIWETALNVPTGVDCFWSWVIVGPDEEIIIKESVTRKLSIKEHSMHLHSAWDTEGEILIANTCMVDVHTTYITSPGQVIGISGSSSALGCWKPSDCLLMNSCYPRNTGKWKASFITSNEVETEWKLVVVDTETKEIVRWEERDNRKLMVRNQWIKLQAHWAGVQDIRDNIALDLDETFNTIKILDSHKLFFIQSETDSVKPATEDVFTDACADVQDTLAVFAAGETGPDVPQNETPYSAGGAGFPSEGEDSIQAAQAVEEDLTDTFASATSSFSSDVFQSVGGSNDVREVSSCSDRNCTVMGTLSEDEDFIQATETVEEDLTDTFASATSSFSSDVFQSVDVSSDVRIVSSCSDRNCTVMGTPPKGEDSIQAAETVKQDLADTSATTTSSLTSASVRVSNDVRKVSSCSDRNATVMNTAHDENLYITLDDSPCTSNKWIRNRSFFRNRSQKNCGPNSTPPKDHESMTIPVNSSLHKGDGQQSMDWEPTELLTDERFRRDNEESHVVSDDHEPEHGKLVSTFIPFQAMSLMPFFRSPGMYLMIPAIALFIKIVNDYQYAKH